MKTLLEQRLIDMLASGEDAAMMQRRIRLLFFTPPGNGYIEDVWDTHILPALNKAYEKHPMNMVTLADAIEITNEEFTEFVQEARQQDINVDDLLKENLHLIAMSIRTLLDVTLPMWGRAHVNDQE